MFSKSISTIFVLFAFIFTLASAIVINPKINVPNEGTQWRGGQTVTIQWDTNYFDGTSNVPIPDGYKGTIKLGYLEGDDYNEHLFWDLATGFALNAGAQSVTLPTDLETRNGYIVVLMGNSGNASKRFRIQAAK
jgi:hypothetical protein